MQYSFLYYFILFIKIFTEASVHFFFKTKSKRYCYSLKILKQENEIM